MQKIPRCQTKSRKKWARSSKAVVGYVYVEIKMMWLDIPIATKVKTICNNTWIMDGAFFFHCAVSASPVGQVHTDVNMLFAEADRRVS